MTGRHPGPAFMAFLAGTLAAGGSPIWAAVALITIGCLRLRPRVRAFFLFTLACGFADGELHRPPVITPVALHAHAIVTGCRNGDGGAVLRLQTDGGLRLRAWSGGACEGLPGRGLRVSGMLAPFDASRNFGAPAEADLARERGLDAGLTQLRILQDDGPQPRDPRAWMPLLRAHAARLLARRLDPGAAAVYAGILWGDRDALTAEQRQDFITTGTVHILVTGGLHTGLAAGIVLGLLRCAGCGRGLAAAGAIPLLWGYVALCGGYLPARRAAIGLTMALAARAAGTAVQALPALFICALAVLIAEPGAGATLGFWLSFGCVASILAFTKPLAHRLRALPQPLAEGLAVSLTAQLGTWPLILLALHTVNPSAVPANLVIVPLAAVAFGAGWLALLAAQAAALWPAAWAAPAAWSAAGAQLVATAIRASAAAFAHLPQARLSVPDPPLWIVQAGYFALAAAAWARLEPGFCRLAARRIRVHIAPARFATAMLLGAELLPLTAIAVYRPPAELRITMLDVGQGDGIVVRTPSGRTILIDTGGKLELHARNQTFSPAERAADSVLLPYLAHENIRRIDVMVLTHPHGDHVGGAAGVLRSMPVGLILDSGQAYPGRAYTDALRLARVRGVPVRRARRGQLLTSGDGVQLDVLAPFAQPLPPGPNTINEGSIVLRLRYHDGRALFMGDAGIPTEARLLAAGDDLHADILKVGHHGSAGASGRAFLAAVRPRIALISVGRHNLFGHPSPRTVDDLRAAGALVLRTDRCGSVQVDPRRITTALPCTEP